MQYTDRTWNDVFGNDLTAVDVVKLAGTINTSGISSWLKNQFAELWPGDPVPTQSDFNRWASDIFQEAIPF